MLARFILDSTGRASITTQAIADSPGASYIAGQAYMTSGEAAFATTDAVAATDRFNGGFRYTSTGILRVYDATAGLPASTSINQGIAMTDDGQACITTENNSTDYHLAGVALASNSRIYVNTLAFMLPLADSGSGAVDTALKLGQGSATFTRATTAWTKLSTGLWAQVASGTARSAYTGRDTTVGTYGGYLAEGARTNSALHGRKIAAGVAAAAWVESNVTAADNATGIDGVANSASTLTAGANDGTILQSLTIASAAKTLSAFVRRKTGTGAVYITLDNDATRTEITSLINSTTYTQVSATQTLANPVLGFKFAASGDELEVDMVMLENSASFASSPIPTTTAAVARNADVLTYDFAGNGGATQGTIYAEGTVGGIGAGATMALVQLSDGTANERTNTAIATAGSGTLFVQDGGVNQVNINTANLVSSNSTPFKLASSYKANNFALCLDAGTVATDSSGTLPTVTEIQIGQNNTGGQPFGTIKNVKIWTTQLPNGELQVITD